MDAKSMIGKEVNYETVDGAIRTAKVLDIAGEVVLLSNYEWCYVWQMSVI